jgi:hypothetical protein
MVDKDIDVKPRAQKPISAPVLPGLCRATISLQFSPRKQPTNPILPFRYPRISIGLSDRDKPLAG